MVLQQLQFALCIVLVKADGNGVCLIKGFGRGEKQPMQLSTPAQQHVNTAIGYQQQDPESQRYGIPELVGHDSRDEPNHGKHDDERAELDDGGQLAAH